MTNIFISEQAIAALGAAALEIQQRLCAEGRYLTPETIEKTLTLWLETSIEALAEEALWHCLEGDRTNAFNRRAFEDGLRRLDGRASTA